jgi:hypothetical protein
MSINLKISKVLCSGEHGTQREEKCIHGLVGEKRMEKNHLQDLDINEKMELKLPLKK